MSVTRDLRPAALAELLSAEREGGAFLACRDADGELVLERLADRERVTIGRAAPNHLALVWDPEVSRTHVQLERLGSEWTLVDDGLSRNGSFVNGERVQGRRRLVDGDMLRVGRTYVQFRAPRPADRTTVAADQGPSAKLSDSELRVLRALCRPVLEGRVPATNREIAGELHLTVDGVKTHVRSLFVKLAIANLPQYSKRTELARRAVEQGLVSRRG